MTRVKSYAGDALIVAGAVLILVAVYLLLGLALAIGAAGLALIGLGWVVS